MKIILKLRHRRIPEMIIYTLPVTRSRNRLLQSDSENTKQFQSLSYSLCWRLKTWLDLVIFVEPCTKINDAYTIVMCFCDRSCCQRYAVSAGKDYVFQQDSAPAHCARATVELLCQETPDFLAPNPRPPNSPDLSPVDYEIWAVMQRRVYQRQIHTVDKLKRQLIDVWCSLEQTIFDETIDQWRGRHRACVHAKGGHFETFEYSL